MSYFRRLRQQSGLAVLDAAAPGAIEDRRVPDDAIDLEVEDVVELRSADAAPAASVRPVPDVAPMPGEPRPGVPPLTMPLRTRIAASGLSREQPQPEAPAAAREPVAPKAPNAARESDRTVQPLQQETVLRQVFQWLAAPPAAPLDDAPSRDGLAQERPALEERRAPTDPGPAPAAVTVPARPSARPASRPSSSARMPEDSIDLDVLEPPRAPVVRRRPDGAPPRIEEPSRESAVEESLTISIGSIAVRVEAPPAAPPLVARPAAPAAPSRSPKRTSSRLARHYLHS